MIWVSVPEAPPVNVHAEPLNSTAVQVWWKPPDPQKINGINQGYKLQAWKGKSNTEVSFNDVSDLRCYDAMKSDRWMPVF
jgi:hypothetical protein